MEEAKKAIAKVAKKIGKAAIKIVLTTLAPVIIIVVILSAALYWLTVDDGTYDEDDWSSTPYAAEQYINDTEINEDGTISSNKSVQEIWDTMEVNKSRVSEYLDNPEELARLMRAELITKYPDTRNNPDEQINWEEIIKNADSLQGVVKFKRADTNGNKSTMIYASPQEFQGYIDEYNRTGSETAKQNALTHFTLKKSGTKTIINYTGPELYWPTDGTRITSFFGVRNDPTGGSGQENHGAIDIGVAEGTNIYACETGKVTTAGWSDSAGNWVVIDHGNGYVTKYMHNSQLKVSAGETVSKGQVIALSGNTGRSTGPHCHFQIEYNGVKIDPLSFKYHNGKGNGTGGFGTNNKVSVDLNENQGTNNKQDKVTIDLKENNKRRAEAVTVNGDGYKEQYTSSAGITYKHYKQYEGSYAENEYWGGTIHDSGCGPTAVAILASGLTSSNYTPGVIATEMDSVYGYTSSDTLQKEMNSLGMVSNVIENPSAETIQENLRNGKVMLVSVNSNTIFTNNSHIMALVDINSNGQVYICNPGSKDKYGWYDVGELMKGCKYVVVTDAGAVGIASSTNASEYTAVVATWRQVDTTITTDDPNVEKSQNIQYAMTTTDINYEEMVKPYTMPFDLLWALLVVGEDKNFIFELTDLIYNSDIQVTIHDNLTTNTDVDEWHYTQKTKAVVDATITADCNGKTETDSISNDIHDPHAEVDYTTTKTVVTKTNTIMANLTKANVWIVDYKNDYTYVAPTQTSTSNTVKPEPDYTEYPESPDNTDNTYTCDHITAKRQELETKVKQKAKEAAEKAVEEANKRVEKVAESGTQQEVAAAEAQVTAATIMSQNIDNVTPNVKEEIAVKYYNKYVAIIDNITNTISSQKYVQGVPEIKEKTDASTAPNFVTIFNKSEYRNNKSKIRDVSSWLFEIIETNNNIKNMLDTVKYLLYKTTQTDYGVKELDYSIFSPQKLISLDSKIYGNEVSEKVWFTLRNVGYSEYAVAGVLGNMYGESGVNPAMIEKAQGGGNKDEFKYGIGLCQWSFGRNSQLRQYAASKGKEWSDVDIQIEFLLAELSRIGDAVFYTDNQISGTYRTKWENATSIEEATINFCLGFERCSESAYNSSKDKRVNAAQSYYDQFKGKTWSDSESTVQN